MWAMFNLQCLSSVSKLFKKKWICVYMSIHVLYRYSRCLSSQRYRNPHPRQSNGGRFPLGLKSQWRSACIINFCMHTVMPVRHSEGALVSRGWRGDTHRHGCLAQRSTLRPPLTYHLVFVRIHSGSLCQYDGSSGLYKR